MHQMQTVLTPCLPKKSCVICDARLAHAFRDQPVKSKAAKYRHQAGWWGGLAVEAIHSRDPEAWALARKAWSFAVAAMREEDQKAAA